MTDRGRIPFALIGVLLLASSAAFSPALAPSRSADQPTVEAAMSELRSETIATLRTAAVTGARQAARQPIIDPANTSAGREISVDTPFRDTVRLRVYLATRQSLAEISGPVRGFEVSASLPSAGDGQSALRDAIDRVEVGRAGPEETRMSVAIEDIALTVRQHGRIVAQHSVSPQVTIGSPVLAMHDRVSRYQRLLEAGPLDRGLGRRLTALLYPVTWARGFAQYRGAPIQNVVANKHISVLTNSAVLALQQATFGAADPLGREVLADAASDVALSDIISASGGDSKALKSLRQLQSNPTLEARDKAVGSGLSGTPNTSVPEPGDRASIGVGAAADRAYATAVDELDGIINRTFTAKVRLVGRVANRSGTRAPPSSPPDSSWTLADTETTQKATVQPREGTWQPPDDDWHALDTIHRLVQRETTRVDIWRKGDQIHRARTTGQERVAVTIRLLGSHHQGPAPTAPIDRVHERHGQFIDIEATARERLLQGEPAVRSRALELAIGENVDQTVSIREDWNPEIKNSILSILGELRAELSSVTVNQSRGELATFRHNPAAKLARTLREGRGEYLQVPDSYRSVSHRAAVGARLQLLETAISGMERRADAQRATRNGMAEALPDGLSIGDLQTALQQRGGPRENRSTPLNLTVDAAPSYLTVDNITQRDVPAVPPGTSEYPLVLANRNLISIPYGSAAGFIASLIEGPTRVRFATAGRTLDAARRVGAPLDELAAELRWATDRIEDVLVTRLVQERIGTATAVREVVERGLDQWGDPGARALAIANGTVADAVAAKARQAFPDVVDSPVAERRLRVQLRVTLQRAREGNTTGVSAAVDLSESIGDGGATVLPKRGPVNRTLDAVRTRLTTGVESALETGLERAAQSALANRLSRTFARLPAGLPLAPIPGMWYATVNAWVVRARGEYTRFAVRAPRGSPVSPAGSILYVRDGTEVRIDIDGDGAGELLGRATRLSFSVRTAVGIAVPPGGSGVGDTEGRATETSEGWPKPGPE